MEKNFYARINAIIKDFERGVRKAQRLAKTSVPNEIETEIKANTTKFQRALTRAKAMAQKWREHKVEIDADASPVKRAILTTKALLRTIRKHTIKIDADVNKFDVLKAKIIRTWHDGGRALGDFSDKMDHLAGRIRSFGTVFGQQIKGVIVASFQALIPIIAGLVPVIMAIGNALKVVTGGAIALAGAVGIAAGGFVAFGAMAISAIKMLNDGTLQATKETQAYQRALDGVKSTWASIIKQNQAQIFNTMANSLNAVKVALQGLRPFFSGISTHMEKASASMLKWAQTSQVAKKFFNAMGTTGVSIFGDLLRAGGQFGAGMVSMFTQLMPLFKWSSQWMRRLGEDFNRWVNSAKGQNAIKQFMEYTKTNLPIIGNIFKNTFAGINNLLKAFGQNSTNIFKWLEQMTARFRAWSETVGKSEGFRKFVNYVQENGPVIMKLIGDIVRILVAFGTAMAPIASALLKVIGAIASFTASLLENHPNVARFFGILTILAGAFWALLAPIMFISSVLTNVFGVTLLQAVGYIIRFISTGNLLKGILSIISGAFRLLFSPIGNLVKFLPMLGTAFTALSGPIGWIIGIIVALIAIFVTLWKTNEGFRNMMIQCWNDIVAAVSAAISGVMQWFSDLWAKIVETLQPIMPLLQQLGQIFMQIFATSLPFTINVAIIAIQALWTVVQTVFQLIGMVISVAVQLIVGLFTALIQFLSGDVSGAWHTLKNTISGVMETIWGTIQSIWTNISNFIFSVLNRILGTNITNWSQVVSVVGQKMGQALGYVISIGAQWVASIGQAMSNFVSSVVQKFWDVVNSCRSGMDNAVSAIRSFFSNFSEVGSYLMQGLAAGIQNGIDWVISAAKGVAESAVSAAKSVLGIASPSKVFKGIGQFVSQGLGVGIANHAYKAVDAVKNVSKQMMSAFDADLEPSFDVGGLGASIAGQVDGFITDDVRHSIQEANKPIVNVTVKNEGDIEYIKSTIEDMTSWENY